jgi:3-phenylpropionate/trans-cinnamate dioxygenase ferredoxin reductase component
MSDLHVKYLLVGGGVASFAAAQAIRARDAQGELLLVGQEINRPYYRTPLTKGFLRRQQDRTSLFTCDANWFVSHGVQMRTGCRVANLDPGRAIAALDSGETISYDRLLLATGATPKPLNIPGNRLPNIYAPRTIEDFEQIHTAIDKAKREGRRHDRGRGRAAVIGGGLFGVELAAGLCQSGLAVDLIVGGPYPWSKFAGEATGRFLGHYLTEMGQSAAAGSLKVHDGQRAIRIEGDGRAQRVVLSGGAAAECDFVVSAVGSVANKELLRGTGIVAEKAILADEHCRTNVPDVYAAGDCAAVRDRIFGKHRAAEQWDTAPETGTIAGKNMAGDPAALDTVTGFTTEVFGLKVRAWGHSKHVIRRILRGAAHVQSPDFLEIGLDGGGLITQILAVGPGGDDAVLKELVRRRIGVNGNEALIRDPGTALENLLA